MNQKKSSEESSILSDILLYGSEILNSDVFREAAREKHHFHGTVADHAINVCVVSLRLANQLISQGTSVCKKDLVRAALCHDLGLVSRRSKYEDSLEAWKKHPGDSAKIAKELLPDLSPEAEKMILSHMWPVGGPVPSSNEGLLLCMADKYGSMADWKTWMTRKRFAQRIKEKLEAVNEAERGQIHE